MTYKYLCINSNSGFIAGNFVFQKKYQKTAGASIKSGVIYNALTGIFSTLIFLIINKFKIDVVPYSCVMAAVFSTALMAYMFIGFKIMKMAICHCTRCF